MKFPYSILLIIWMFPLTLAAKDADSVINKYIDAIGGRVKLENVKDRTTFLSGTVEGTKVTITIYQKAPNFFRQDITSRNINQVLYFNGTKGILISDAGETELKGKTLNDLKLDAYLNPVLDLKQKGIKAELTGTPQLDSKTVYKIELETDSSRKWIEYYDPDTGLKLRQVKTISSSTGNFDQVTDFEDYRLIDGIKYPFRLIQSIGNQKIEMNVKFIKVNSGIEDEFFSPQKN